MAVRAKGSTPYEIRTDDKKYPLKDILAAADLVGGGSEVLSRQAELLNHPDDIVKYWALIGLISQGQAASGVVEQVAVWKGVNTDRIEPSTSDFWEVFFRRVAGGLRKGAISDSTQKVRSSIEMEVLSVDRESHKRRLEEESVRLQFGVG